MSTLPVQLVWPAVGTPPVRWRRSPKSVPPTSPIPQIDAILQHTEALEGAVRNLQAALGVVADSIHDLDSPVDTPADAHP